MEDDMSRSLNPVDGAEEPVRPERRNTSADPDPYSADHRLPAEPAFQPDDRPADEPPAAPVIMPNHREVLVRQRERFGGVKFGSAFFGWLAATGLAAILVAVLAAVAVATGTTVDQAADRSWTVGTTGAVLLLVILFVAYLAGGYVAGRMARFNGIRQGVAVWVWGVVITALLAGIAAVAGSRFDVLATLNVPQVRIGDQTSVWQTVIAISIAAASALGGAVLGGLAGMRFHRRVDRADITPVPEAGNPTRANGS